MTLPLASPVRITWGKKRSPEEQRLRRVATVWALLFFDVLGSGKSPILPIPHKVAQLLTQGGLLLALGLALSLNPRVRIRPNIYLGLYSVLAASTLMMSVRFVSLGTAYRAGRLVLFLVVLWLLTPWFGRKDMLLLRIHMRLLIAILVSVAIGFMISPHSAYPDHRLSGALWPVPATQVAHYAAEMTGLALLMWACGKAKARRSLCIALSGALALLMTHTRTALLAAVLGLVVAGLSLLTANRRVRRAFVVVTVLAAVAAVGPSAFLTSWLTRGESANQLHSLTGRTNAWNLVLSNPRPETNKILGSGLSNNSVNYEPVPSLDGLPIDSSWISTYQDQGILGDVLDGSMLLVLVITPLFRPGGPRRALAMFLIVYCLTASFTETGLGEASPYLLDLAVAASLLARPVDEPELSAPALAGV